MRRSTLSLHAGLAVGAVHAQQGPQPFMLVSVVHPYEGQPLQEVGTVCDTVDFRHWDASADRLDSVLMHAKLLEKTPRGFRFSWTVVQRRRGKEVARITRTEFVPWGTRKQMKSVPGYTVEVFYSPIPANELNPFRSNHALQPTADRRVNYT